MAFQSKEAGIWRFSASQLHRDSPKRTIRYWITFLKKSSLQTCFKFNSPLFCDNFFEKHTRYWFVIRVSLLPTSTCLLPFCFKVLLFDLFWKKNKKPIRNFVYFLFYWNYEVFSTLLVLFPALLWVSLVFFLLLILSNASFLRILWNERGNDHIFDLKRKFWWFTVWFYLHFFVLWSQGTHYRKTFYQFDTFQYICTLIGVKWIWMVTNQRISLKTAAFCLQMHFLSKKSCKNRFNIKFPHQTQKLTAKTMCVIWDW